MRRSVAVLALCLFLLPLSASADRGDRQRESRDTSTTAEQARIESRTSAEIGSRSTESPESKSNSTSSSQSFTIANGSWTNLDPSTSFSLSFWLKLSSLPGSNQYTIVSKDNGTSGDFRVLVGASASGNNSIYVLWSDNGSFSTTQAHLGEYDGPASYFTSSDIGTWVHVALVVDATNQTVTVYKNGSATTLTKRAGSAASTISQSAVRFDVGRTQTTYYLDGSLDELRFWKNYKLTAGEVATLYDGSYVGSNAYAYAGTGYPNPHAPTSIGNGTATSTYAYDNNGNLTSVISGATTTLYTWDYANRLTQTAIGSGGSTTTITYAYDWLGNRVMQTVGGAATTTTHYPTKFYSAIVGATTTEYIYSGDTLLSTVDTSGASTTVRYIHPDHLGSTNVVTDSTGQVVQQTLDYYPYGATRINSKAGADAGRKYIGQFTDMTDLDYLNARYYDPARGQFISEDPVFWENPKAQNLMNPQSLNSYSYANGNPITNKDPNGNASLSSILSSLVSALRSLLSILGGGSVGVSGGSSVQTGGSSGVSQGGSGSGNKTVQVQPPGGFVTQKTDTGCFDACKEMAGYTPTGNRIITSAFENGALVPQSDAQKGIQTIDNYLANGRTPIVGVNMNGGTEPLNVGHDQTQHYVVIVGSGTDGGGKYYNFYDPGTSHPSKGTSPDNKLYVNGNTLSGKSAYNQGTATYVVTEVRP